MLEKLLKEIMVLIAGKQAEEIVDLLDGKKYVNEFMIAKKLNLTINQTRNILYKISDHGLVSFTRKKDKRKGWYTYFWKIEILKCLEFLKANLIKKMDQINHQIKSRETKEFYVCDRCHIEFTEENALLYNFICPECGNLLSRKDNTGAIKDYNKDLDRLKRELALVEEELAKEREKLEKSKVRATKKEEKLKKKTRDIATKERKRIREAAKKEAIKNTKKELKKKSKTKKSKSSKKKKVKASKKKATKKKKVKASKKKSDYAYASRSTGKKKKTKKKR
jgi:transcription initiation factor TFIIE subunit alpha